MSIIWTKKFTEIVCNTPEDALEQASRWVSHNVSDIVRFERATTEEVDGKWNTTIFYSLKVG